MNRFISYCLSPLFIDSIPQINNILSNYKKCYIYNSAFDIRLLEQTANIHNSTEKLILNTNTITPLLKRMEEMGFLQRTPSNADKRKVIVSLTPKGDELRHEAATIPFNLLKRLNMQLDEKNLAETAEFKCKLNEMIALLKALNAVDD